MWEILGIEPTKDIRTIKKAYAALAKKYNPEEYPDEFRRIHDAYKSACAYAKDNTLRKETPIREKESVRIIHDTQQNDPVNENPENEFDFGNIAVSDSLMEFAEYPYDKRSDALIRYMKKMLASDIKRNDRVLWAEFFRSKAFESMIFDVDFRRRSADIFFSELLEHETAVVIASGFSYGTQTETVNYYPVHESTIKIAVHPLRYCQPMKNPVLIDEDKAPAKASLRLILIICAVAFALSYLAGTIWYFLLN